MNKIRKIKSRATIALSLLILAAILIAALQCLVGCANSTAPAAITIPEYRYKVYTIDSCEYIAINTSTGFCHKGNCRYCQRRQQAQLNTLLNQIFD